MITQRVTIEDVAARAGVSIATVSRVLNASSKVSEATRQRVQAAIAELNYHPSAAARNLAANRTHTIGVVLEEISGEFFQPMLRGIESAATQHGYDLLIHTTRRADGKPTSLGRFNTDGVIVFANSQTETSLINIQMDRFPLVLLHRSAPKGTRIPSVIVENKAGAQNMVDHLIEKCGRRRIAFLRGPEGHEDSFWREVGYRESLAAHQIDFDPSIVGVGNFDIDTACHTVREWMANNLQIDAIFAGDDESAIGALTALKEAGKRVPEDIALVGFDDIRLAAFLAPPLTTVRSPIEAAAAQAVEQLIRLMTTGEADLVTMLPTELVVRESCGYYLAGNSK